MSRFRLLAVLMASLLLTALAGAAEKPARIAWLGAGSEAGSAEFVSAFKQGLKDNGLADGRDYILDAVYADSHYERFDSLVRELLQRDPAVIVVVTVASVRAAQKATKTVPIVMMSTNDPVKTGLVESLARPGGNTTGLGTMASDVAEKYVQLLKELRPGARRLAVLVNPGNPSNAAIFKRIESVARAQGIAAQEIRLTGSDDMGAVFAALAREHPDALVLASDLSFLDRRAQICALALKHRIPIFAHAPDFAEAGCLAGFGTSRRDLYRHSATYVKKILAGAKPAELPVELPMRFGLAVDLRTAKALGIVFPYQTLLRADRVIE